MGKRMNDETQDQAGQRRALETKIVHQIDQACVNLREDFAREKERRDESQKRREKKVADEILRITESLDIERKNRLAGKLQSEEEQRQADEEALIKKLLADINEVHNGIKCEGVIRQRSESHIVQVLEDMCGKLHEETCESIALRASSKTLVE